MDIIVVMILGVITLVAIIAAIRAKGETGKLTADNAILKASLEEAQGQARSADDDAKRVRELELENTRLAENLVAEKAESAKVNGLNEKIVSLTSENAKLNVKVDDLKERLEERAVLEERFADSFKALSAETLEQQNKNFMANADISFDDLDREALVALYDATDGENWTKNTNWKTNKSLSEWFGVKTNSAGQVVLLSLSDNALSGQIPKTLGQLTNLKRLYLHNNALSGQIPKALGQLANLERLWLFDNALSGQIPKALGQLKKLKELALNNNKLSGGIPGQLGQLTNLKTLVLSDNALSGQIPKALGQLANLERLYLYNNRLSKHIPVELEQLTNLEERKEIWVRNNAGEVSNDVEFQT